MDHLATPRLVADENQKTVWRWDQAEPFGNNPANEDPDGDGVAFDFPMRFPGQYYDRESGLHYNYFRDYDPSVGMYKQSDPNGLLGGLNTYAYALADPVRWFDAEGLIVTNKPPPDPKTPWKGTQIPGGQAYQALNCMEYCLGVPDILISGGSECTPGGSHQPGTAKGSRHCANQAFDIPWYWIRTIDPKKLLCCAKDCGVKYIQDEGTHLHFATTRGKYGGSGILPSDQDCMCKP